jgi:hypothetical protein
MKFTTFYPFPDEKTLGIIYFNPPIKIFDSFQEIQEFNPKLIDKKIYTKIKLLEKNKEFESEIIKSRIKLKIPLEGYKLENPPKFKNIEEFSDFIRKANNEEKRIALHFEESDPYIVTNLQGIICFNAFELDENITDSIFLIGINQEGMIVNDAYLPLLIDSVKIVIHKKVTKNELKKFIDNNWAEIEKSLNSKYVSKDRTFISERDFKIVNLRDNKSLKYSKIADIIAKETKDYSVNEDSIKTAYKRAKVKIKKGT